MIALVAGGGFVPQSPTDSLELTDSTMVRNAKNGYKGNFFIQFSFSFASLCRSVGFGHDLRSAVDNPKSSFRTLGTINGNRDWTVRNGETIFAMTGHPLDFHPRDVLRLDP
jgi:hypothetical protein